jgi:predicted NUDIX family NTP pyrophosphohydrolase
MPPKASAGLLLFRRRAGILEVLLVHPGGPFWARRDDGAWSIPKGEIDEGEDHLAAARREVAEETGARPDGPFIALDPVRQPSGKIVHVWIVESDFDPGGLTSNEIEIEWPPRSGRHRRIPEVDRAEWFTLDVAARKILDGLRPFLAQLAQRLAARAREP